MPKLLAESCFMRIRAVQRLFMVISALLLGLTPALCAESTPFSASNTAWIITASALVLFMTLPGLAMFYGGLVRAKNVLSVMMQCVVIACLSSVLWLAIGYSLSFGVGNGFIGDLSKVFMLSSTRDALIGTLPESVFMLFQMTFAVITPALMIGAFPERMRFGPVVIFSGLWLLLVYAPVAHWVWGGGWLMDRHVMDFAGGLVVHATAGTSAIIVAIALGARDGFPRDIRPPHNPGMTMIGAGMLWVGWFGFNGGSALTADQSAGFAILATHISAATAGLVWMALEWIRLGRPSMIGTVTGVVAGLATVTPASGYVSPVGGMILGVCGSLVCFYAVDVVKHKWKIDDSLDVFAVHGVGGILGSLLVAILAHPDIGGVGYDGGNVGEQFITQSLGVGATMLWSAVVTAILIYGLRAMIGIRASEDDIDEGLDLTAHGERGYTLQ
jgi:ammonium transporter, Amt family